MEGLDAQSLISLRLMLRQLEVLGVVPTVLGALSRVPRQRFVERFWSPPFGVSDPSGIREWDIGRDDPSQVASLLHEPSLALAVHASYDWGDATSTLSAPVVIASLLQNLDVQPGMRVLEIGTGTGYTTALLAELTGDANLVTSIEIDGQLADSAEERLSDLDYRGVHLVVGDGDLGVDADAPYDRILATVGCEDLSPAWAEQLSSDGLVVAPMSRGLEHPVIRAQVRSGAFVSRVVNRSTFVRIQGVQALSRSVPKVHSRVENNVEWRPMPAGVAAALDGDDAHGAARRWSLEHYLALRAPASDPAVLVDEQETSSAVLDTTTQSVGSSGPAGAACLEDLLSRVTDWLELGSPTPMDYLSSWQAIPEEIDAPGQRMGPWACDRVHYLETVELDWGEADR